MRILEYVKKDGEYAEFVTIYINKNGEINEN